MLFFSWHRMVDCYLQIVVTQMREVHLVDYMWYLMKWLIHVRNWFLSTCNGNLFGPYTLPFCVPIWMECDVTLAQEHCLMGATFSHQWKNPHRAGYKGKKRTRISWKVISFLSLLTIFINVSDYHNGYETKNNKNRSCLTNCLKMKKTKKTNTTPQQIAPNLIRIISSTRELRILKSVYYI